MATILRTRRGRRNVRVMRGYFSIGVERVSKPGNVGNLVRSAHAFGASYFFAVDPAPDLREMGYVDTSDATTHLPIYVFDSAASMVLPMDCTLVGVELTDDAVELPSFRHPTRAAYLLGPERGSLSPEAQARCEFIVKIPTRFCVNVGIAGAIVIYDRMISLGRWAERPVRVGPPLGAPPTHVHGKQKIRDRSRRGQTRARKPATPDERSASE